MPDPYRIVGRRTWIHPTLAMVGHFDRKIEPYSGAPQTVGSHHFALRPGKMGYFLETPPAQPMLAGLAHAGFGPGHRQAMKELPNTAVLIGLLIDGFLDEERGGTVAKRGGGRLSFVYERNAALSEAMREAMKTMARVHLAAGAREVLTFHEPPLRIRSERDLSAIDSASVAPNRCALFTAHQMGGAPMGEDPGIAIVDSRLKHHLVDNLYVMDGSVFPTALGVNPMISILGVSSLRPRRARAVGLTARTAARVGRRRLSRRSELDEVERGDDSDDPASAGHEQAVDMAGDHFAGDFETGVVAGTVKMVGVMMSRTVRLSPSMCISRMSSMSNLSWKDRTEKLGSDWSTTESPSGRPVPAMSVADTTRPARRFRRAQGHRISFSARNPRVADRHILVGPEDVGCHQVGGVEGVDIGSHRVMGSLPE
jgi:hypothetical protein